jgi:hypothetical protein
MATECQIGFATLKTQFINQFINHRRFLAILCLVCLEMNVQAKQCALLWIFISKEKFKSDDYSYTHWWIDPPFKFIQQDVKLSRSVSSFAGRKLLCSHLSILDYIIPGYSKRTQGWALSGHYLYGDESGVEFWVPEFWNLRITSTTTPAVFFFDSDSSQMLFNPYNTCWGINTGTRLYHVRSG